MTPRDRMWQLVLIVGAIGFSWLGLQVVHEAGHVLHAYASGGTVARVVLRPTTISETLVLPNPHPRFVAWGGPVWGCAIPLVIWGVAWAAARRFAFLARFFAGSCLVANGAYLGASAFAGGPALDGQVILAHGGSMWTLLLFSFVAIAAGLRTWSGLGPRFGFGADGGRVDREAAIVAAVLMVMLVLAEWAAAAW
ncbi:MAG: hypothetical protein JW719_07215 [Pirellulales bacterium]|nr:hypothetical protein [Pirellulales bacterium]